MAEFNATERSKPLMPTLAKSFQDVAFAQADEFINAGQSVKEAASIVANILVETAWVVAGCGVVADGGVPNKDNFRAAVEATLERITFKDPEAGDTDPTASKPKGGSE
jgi:hypothetical protein